MIRGVATALHLVPTVFGLADGDFRPGAAAAEGAQAIDTIANTMNERSSLSGIRASYNRRTEDWQLQKDLAQDDVYQIQQQIQAAQYQVDMAQQDIDVLETNLSQEQQVEDFLTTKFTSQELYQWMVGKLSALYFQGYQMAYNLALSAQSAWQFERGHSQSFISPTYWDDLHKGLVAGEAVMLSLQAMEKAAMDQDLRRFEITKTISLRLLLAGSTQFEDAFTGDDPTGVLEFDLGELLYDLDYVGHYCRQIKSVTLSIPAVIGPYQNIHATLSQTSNKVIIQPDIAAVNYLLGVEGGTASAGSLRSDYRAHQQIALSQGINDSGLFELNFRDERYLPFEGTGAVSSWQLEIPPESNPGILESMTDVIMEIRYTTLAGDNAFKTAVAETLKDMRA